MGSRVEMGSHVDESQGSHSSSQMQQYIQMMELMQQLDQTEQNEKSDKIQANNQSNSIQPELSSSSDKNASPSLSETTTTQSAINNILLQGLEKAMGSQIQQETQEQQQTEQTDTAMEKESSN